MSDYVPLCTMNNGITIMTTKSFWRWFNKGTTDGQLAKLRYLVYNYAIEVTIPRKCGHTSQKIAKIEKAIKEGKVKERKMKHGHIKMVGRTYVFVPMSRPVAHV